MELDSVFLGKVTQSQKNTHCMHSLIRMLVKKKKLKINKLQFTNHRKLKMKED